MSSMRACVRLEIPLAVPLEGRVAEEGGDSSGFRTVGLSRTPPPFKDVEMGVIGRGLSGEGVLGTE